jgi:hypothetical protein
MNQIVASLYFHAGEVLAFELTIRALNDYHLKEVHMMKLPGLYHHCEVLEVLIKKEFPILKSHLDQLGVSMLVICQNWIMCLMT